jgi:lipopolysaccharide transport system ATP-binding protein
MAVRLAFAVASHLETEIILIDEVLAVGDAAFQKKCMALLSRSVMEGRTALIVSHNMGLIRSLCSRAILLEKGRIIADAPTEDVISLYFKSVVSGQDGYKADTERVHARLYVSEAYCCDAQGNRNSQVACGENLGVRLTLSSPKADTLQKAKIHLRIYSAMGEFISYVGSKMAGFEFPQIQNGDSVICEIQNLNIAPGEYYLGFIIADGNNIYDAAENALSFTVTTTDYFGTGDLPTGRHGQVLLKSRWRLE